jgi:carbonic anhydrase
MSKAFTWRQPTSIQHRLAFVAVFCWATIACGCMNSSRKDPGPAITGHSHPNANSPVSADDALNRLMTGNARFAAEKSSHPNISAERRKDVKQGQAPYAVVLGCADSRLSPELIFDAGLGDLFVVRVAGNVTDDIVIGSIEYAVEHLGSRLIVVLGHEKCGAVDAALSAADTHSHMYGHIQSLVDAIDPALRGMSNSPGDRLDDAVRANVRYVTNQLEHSKPILEEFMTSGGLRIVGGYYDLESGRVELLTPN